MRMFATTDITPRATWKVQPSFSSSWWQPFCSYWVSTNKQTNKQKDSFYEGKTNTKLIFSIIEKLSVSEQQNSTPMGPKFDIAHASSTVSTVTFNPHKKVSKTHFNIILPFPSKLCISDTYNFLQHVKC